MTNITSGRVVYSRTVKTGDFENKKFEVELCYNVDEGQDASTITDEVGSMAVAKCHAMLGLKGAAPVVTKPTEPATGAKEAAAASMNGKDAATKKGPGRPPKTKATDTDELPDPAPTKAEPAKAGSEVSGDPTDDFDTPLAAPEVTDVDLTSAASRKNAELSKTHQGAAPAMVRKLIGTFFADPTGKRVSDIPQDKRKAFLEQLEALK